MAHTFLMPQTIQYGNHALTEAAPTLETLGKKAFILCDDTMMKLKNTEMLTAILESINISYVVFSKVNSEPTDLIIQEAVQLFEQSDCDFFIALGGGSPIDAMKAVMMVHTSKQPIDNFLHTVFTNKHAPMVAIPTTAGTGSEATQFTIITNTKTNVKMLLKGSSLLPDLVIVDPMFTLSVPPAITAATGIDAFCHALEAFTSKKAHSLSNHFACSAIKKIVQFLPLCYTHGNSLAYRQEMSLAALEAGIAFNNASVHIVHGMSRPIGALFHIPHGLSNAMILFPIIQSIQDEIIPQLAFLARECNISNVQDDLLAAQHFIDYIYQLLKLLEIPTLAEYGIQKFTFYETIEKMSNDALASGSPANCIKTIDKETIIKLYHRLYP